MNIQRTLLVAFIVVALIVTMIEGTAYYRVRQHRAEALRSMDKVNNYQRGFFDGMNAVIKHLEYDTNAGKFKLELTNVLNEMKPVLKGTKP